MKLLLKGTPANAGALFCERGEDGAILINKKVHKLWGMTKICKKRMGYGGEDLTIFGLV